jgi:hypothetical protein
MSEASKTSRNKSESGSGEETIKVKCLIQQCIYAKLQVKLADKEKNIDPEYVQVRENNERVGDGN